MRIRQCSCFEGESSDVQSFGEYSEEQRVPLATATQIHITDCPTTLELSIYCFFFHFGLIFSNNKQGNLPFYYFPSSIFDSSYNHNYN